VLAHLTSLQRLEIFMTARQMVLATLHVNMLTPPPRSALPPSPPYLPCFQECSVLAHLTSLQRLEMFHDCPGHLDGSLQHQGPYALTPQTVTEV
jgi:hypothetical protein